MPLLKYSADNYIEKKQSALNVDVIDVEFYGDFLICILPQENDVINCICYCDDKEIIRYLTIVGVPTGDVFVLNILNGNNTGSVKW